MVDYNIGEKGNQMENNFEIKTNEIDGRWDDQNWVNEQAELSATEDMFEKEFEIF